MVKYSTNSSKDFVSPSLSEELIKAGFDISDSRYKIGLLHNELYIAHNDDLQCHTLFKSVPTYSLYDILCKIRHASKLRDTMLSISKGICRGKTIEEYIFNSVDPANTGAKLILDAYKILK